MTDDRRKFALNAAADALERDYWYLLSILQDYNDPASPVTVKEVIYFLRKAARES